HRGCRQTGFGLVRRPRTPAGQAPGDRLGDLTRVAAGPDPRTVDAAAAAVQKYAVDHDVEELLPSVHLIVADQDFRETGTVRLHRGVATVAIDRCGAAEDQVAPAMLEHRGADVAEAGINRDGLARNAGGKEGLAHA